MAESATTLARIPAPWRAIVAQINGLTLTAYGRVPDGLPGIRDVDAPCDVFEPGKPQVGGDCWTDGHYLCLECIHIDPDVYDERRRGIRG